LQKAKIDTEYILYFGTYQLNKNLNSIFSQNWQLLGVYIVSGGLGGSGEVEVIHDDHTQKERDVLYYIFQCVQAASRTHTHGVEKLCGKPTKTLGEIKKIKMRESRSNLGGGGVGVAPAFPPPFAPRPSRQTLFTISPRTAPLLALWLATLSILPLIIHRISRRIFRLDA